MIFFSYIIKQLVLTDSINPSMDIWGPGLADRSRLVRLVPVLFMGSILAALSPDDKTSHPSPAFLKTKSKKKTVFLLNRPMTAQGIPEIPANTFVIKVETTTGGNFDIEHLNC